LHVKDIFNILVPRANIAAMRQACSVPDPLTGFFQQETVEGILPKDVQWDLRTCKVNSRGVIYNGLPYNPLHPVQNTELSISVCLTALLHRTQDSFSLLTQEGQMKISPDSASLYQ
jgi:hypothetical protein